MKKINKFLLFILVPSLFFGCGDEIEFTADDSQRGPNFLETSISVSVPEENITVEIPIQFASLSSAERVYDIEVVSLSDNGELSEFSIGSAVIPANQIEGIARISFDFADITGGDGDLKEVKLSMANPDGAPSNEIEIDYFREVVCNDVVVTINPDAYPGETSWEIVNRETGAQVASGGSTGATVFLPDGGYTFTISDSFGDGICCAYGDGSYSVDCSIINHASGASFAASESTDFDVNP